MTFHAQTQPSAADGVNTRGRGKGWRRKRGKPRKGAVPAPCKVKTSYRRGVSVDDGVKEAMSLLSSSPAKRLERCVYRYQHQDSDTGNWAVHHSTACNFMVWRHQ
jgi:hypothetical protein